MRARKKTSVRNHVIECESHGIDVLSHLDLSRGVGTLEYEESAAEELTCRLHPEEERELFGCR
jgi:hypothetical protein